MIKELFTTLMVGMQLFLPLTEVVVNIISAKQVDNMIRDPSSGYGLGCFSADTFEELDPLPKNEVLNDCPEAGWVPFGGDCFYFGYSDTNLTSYETMHICKKKKGGALISIHGQEENEFIFGKVNSSIPLNGMLFHKTWLWADGTAWDYTNWGADQPGEEDCLMMLEGGNWTTADCGQPVDQFVCRPSVQVPTTTTTSTSTSTTSTTSTSTSTTSTTSTSTSTTSTSKTATTSPTTTAPKCQCDMDPGIDYLYLGADHIVKLPSFEKFDCDQNFPGSLSDATAGLVTLAGEDTERLMLCGGFSMTGCFKLEEDGWHKVDYSFDRHWAASSPGVDGKMMVSGGETIPGYTQLNTTATYFPDGWHEEAELPYPVIEHCQLQSVDKLQVYILGGFNRGPTVWVYNEGNWQETQNMNTPRHGHTCLTLSEPGRLMMVLGGKDLNSTEVFNGTEWKSDKVLPKSVYNGQSIKYKNKIYVFGGSVSDGAANTEVYSLDLSGSAEWETLTDVTLEEPERAVFPAQVVTTVSFPCV